MFNLKKIRFCSLSLSLLTLGIIGPAQIYAVNVHYENQPVESLQIEVQDDSSSASLHANKILSQIKTKENHYFSQSQFDRDLKVLAKDYDRIEPILKSTNGKMHITIKVWPKPLIRNIEFFGNEKLSQSSLQKELGVPLTSIFDRQAFNKAFNKLKTYYIKNGYFEAKLNYDVQFNENTNDVDISINIDEGRAGRIKNIYFEGFNKEEQEDLLEVMYTQKYNFFLSWFTEQGTYNEEAIQQDQYIILNYLQNKGYADAEVSIQVCDSDEPDRIDIIIHLERGGCYTFGPISIEGNKIFDQEIIGQQLCFARGKPYSPERIRATIENLTKLYGKCGYIDVNVNFEPKLIYDTRSYSIHITIDEGEQYRVGLIKIIGNCTTKSSVILHEILVAPGDIFNQERLTLTEKRLSNIGYFKNVNVYAVKSTQEKSCLGNNYRDVIVEVEETTTGSFGAFAGFSTAEDLFAGFNITEKNFNIAGFKSIFSEGAGVLRGGGEFANFTATVGAKSRKYVASWTKPYFYDTPWTVGFDIENSNNRYISDDYQINTTGLNIHGLHRENAFLSTGIHYRIRVSHIDLEDKDPGVELKRQAKIDDGILSAVGCNFMYDSTNSILRPSKGFRSRFEMEVAGVGGDYSFFSMGYKNTYYYQIGDKGVIKFRGDLLFIQPIHSTYGWIPIDERLFLGGEYEVRGYRPYRLGPKFPSAPDDKGETHSTDDPSGGLSLQFLSLEYQYRIFPIVDGFTFVDIGSLTEDTWKFGKLYPSVGFGLRLQVLGNGSPPLTFGWGFPLGHIGSTNIKRFFIDIGGRF